MLSPVGVEDEETIATSAFVLPKSSDNLGNNYFKKKDVNRIKLFIAFHKSTLVVFQLSCFYGNLNYSRIQISYCSYCNRIPGLQCILVSIRGYGRVATYVFGCLANYEMFAAVYKFIPAKLNQS